MADVRRLDVATPQGESGTLFKEGDAYLFGYAAVDAAAAISLTMPVRAAQYSRPELHPIFQMNLPEGFMLEELRNRLAKIMVLDPMMLVAISGSHAPIGRVRVHTATMELLDTQAAGKRDYPTGERLSEILSWDGAENLFTELVDRYILRAGVSGVQPKVLVPEKEPDTSRATVITHELIVKSGRVQYPGLAANEFLCMSIAKEARLVVPEFYLSKNRELLVMRRFDRTDAGEAIGFEDMAVLTGRGAERKYEGSYADIAKAVRINASPGEVQNSLHELFDSVTLSCIVGNGDAHLKNYGLLYTDPTCDDCRLAPAFDIVNTTAYIPEDVLALELGGSKSFFASRQHLLGFAKLCDVHDPRGRIENLLHAAERVMTRERDVAESIPDVVQAIGRGMAQFDKTFLGPRL
jgi:serine/threonine-protein kinase HipA